MQPFVKLQPTPSDAPLNDAQPNQQPTQVDFIHNFSSIEWHDTEPNTVGMLHLLTITGILVVAQYDPQSSHWGQHYIAWAPLSDGPVQFH